MVTVEKAWEAEVKSGSYSDGRNGDVYVNQITGHRYFAVDRGRFTGFNLTDCEECGKPVQQGNAVGYVHTREEMIFNFGMIELDRVPEELGYCEATMSATCMECYVEEEE